MIDIYNALPEGDKEFINDPARRVLFAMNKKGMPMYQGTATSKSKNARRAKNRVAKKSRKTNR